MNVVELLSQLIEIESVNDPIKGIKPGIDCAKYIRDHLVSNGLPADIIESNGYYTVYGVIGKGRPIIMFMAHYDTVPVALEEWNYDPFKLTIVNEKGFGRGSADDKGNVAAILVALSKLKDKVKDFTLIYAFTGDEEVGGADGAGVLRDKLLKEGLKPDYVINGDGQGLNVVIRRRCIFRVDLRVKESKVRVKGRKIVKKFKIRTPVIETRHAAYFIPGVDTHPLLEASYYQRVNNLYVSSIRGAFIKTNVLPSWVKVEFVEEDPNGDELEVDIALTKLLESLIPIARCPIKTELFSEYGVTITPNYYLYDNGKHVLRIDIRAMTTNIKHIEDALKHVLENMELKAYLDIKGGTGYLYTPRESKLVKSALTILKELGLKPKTIELLGASDSRYFSPLGIECIDIGPIGDNIHGPNEYVELWSLHRLTEFYEKIPIALRKVH